jgi:hypothetical protein
MVIMDLPRVADSEPVAECDHPLSGLAKFGEDALNAAMLSRIRKCARREACA